MANSSLRRNSLNAPFRTNAMALGNTPLNIIPARVMVLGGGGGGSKGTGNGQAGGAGGGNFYEQDYVIWGAITVTVGAGGAGTTNSSSGAGTSGANGGDSSLVLNPEPTLVNQPTVTFSGNGGVSIGNANGLGLNATGLNDASGGRSGNATNKTFNSGGVSVGSVAGGGGGGSGGGGGNAVSDNPGNGGNGSVANTTGSTYGGGGAGVGQNKNAGGGNGGGTSSSVNGTPSSASAGTGGGAGAAGRSAGFAGANGGSGAVIIRYPNTYKDLTVGSGLVFTTANTGGNKIYTFTAGAGTVIV